MHSPGAVGEMCLWEMRKLDASTEIVRNGNLIAAAIPSSCINGFESHRRMDKQTACQYKRYDTAYSLHTRDRMSCSEAAF